ncbi:MAG TPA: Calx-beta domain-containing protein, partial [Nocardioidaceae bacterium]|nr:Calx-beta domain-containing protein [Nocardioidaceae bacterium]
ISHVRDARLVDGRATGTIRDDDPKPPPPPPPADPTVSIADFSVTNEASPAEPVVKLSAASTKTVTVQWATNDLSPASAQAGKDYTANSGTVTFMPGETSKSVPITISKDGLTEQAETFQVKLDAPTNATPGPQTVATVTILSNTT